MLSTGNSDLIIFLWIMPLRTYKFRIINYRNATSLKLQNIILWNLVASNDIICRCAYWLEILISWIFQELCSIELLSLLGIQYVGACGIWACSLRFFHCLYNILWQTMLFSISSQVSDSGSYETLVRIQDLIKWS